MGQICDVLAGGGNQLTMGQPLQGGGGQQACFKCQGKGFMHTSSMNHDKGPHEKCFFCETCDGCGGSGRIQGQTTVVQQVQPVAVVQPMGMVQPVGGMGMMGGMGGCQMAAPVVVAAPGIGMGGMGGATVQTSQGLQPCFKCNGNGFCHESSMTHDKGPDEKCFFCKSCNSCGGSGAIQGGTTTVQQVGGMGGMGMMGGGAVVATTQGLQPCFKCDGKGFAHESSMGHDKAHNEKCFFCEDCSGCGGSGAIEGGQTTVQQVPGVMPVVQPMMGMGMQQPGMMGMQQPGMMGMQQPGMMAVQQPGMMGVQQPGMMGVQMHYQA